MKKNLVQGAGLAACLVLSVAAVVSTVRAAPARAAKGDIAPDFTATALDGKKVTLSTYRGKNPVVVSFFAEFAAASRKDFPHLKELDEQLGARGLRVIAVSQDESREPAARLAGEHRVKFPVVLDRDTAIAARYGVQALPHSVVIDRDGRIQAVIVGSDRMALERSAEQVVK